MGRGRDRLGRPARRRVARRRARLLLRRHQAGSAQADMASGHTYVQPSDASSRPGALHADAGRRQTRRYRSAVPADLATGPARGGEVARRPCNALEPKTLRWRSGAGSMTDLRALETELLAAAAAAKDEAALEAVRVAALGRNGSVSALLKTLGTMTPEARKEQGPLINSLKDRLSAAIAARKDALRGLALEQRLNTEAVDVTLPVREPPAEIGRVHPISQVVGELTAIFAGIAFAVAEGPDIETDDYNFTKLNFPEGHPAREMHDTFYFPPKPDGTRMLLRTHTSPVQIRTMLAQKPPIRVIIPGRTYRSDSDQTHTPMFHQVEGLVIDKRSEEHTSE